MKIPQLRAAFCDIEIEQDPDHPNSMPFQGTLLILDAPSDKAPNGSDSHRILVPRAVAERRLSTLLNMGINYTDTLNRHNPRHKVGVITSAWIEGNRLRVKGTLWKKDFPEVVDDIKGQALGMSMELADILIRDKNEPVWYLTDFYFTGATVLWPQAAAYHRTTLAASAERRSQGDTMKKVVKKPAVAAKTSATSVIDAISANIDGKLDPVLKELRTNSRAQLSALQDIANSLKTLNPAVQGLEASEDDEDDATDPIEELQAMLAADDMAAAGEDTDDEDGEDLDAASADDEEEMVDDDPEEEIEAEDSDPTPGKLNKTSKQKGHKQTVTNKVGPNKAMKIAAAATTRIRDLSASLSKERRARRTLANKVEAMEAQIEQYNTRIERKSLSSSASALLERGGLDTRDLFANAAGGKVLSVRQVDEAIQKAGVNLDPVTKMRIKNELIQAGLMEQGVMSRQLN